MPPFHPSSSATQPADDTTASGSGGTPNTTDRGKPSLGGLDGGNLATREEDLRDGPMLLQMGDVHANFETHDYPTTIDLGSGTEVPDRSGSDRDISGYPNMMITSTTALRQTAEPSEFSTSAPSDSGPSYSVPTDGRSTTNISTNYKSLDSEVQAMLPKFDDGTPGLFSWNHGFTWENFYLSFDGEPFLFSRGSTTTYSNTAVEASSTTIREPIKENSPDIEGDQASRESNMVDLTGVGGFSIAIVPDQDSSEEEEDFSEEEEDFSEEEEGEDLDAHFSGHQEAHLAQMAMEKTIDKLVALLLERYFRSFALQTTGKRKQSTQGSSALYGGNSAREKRKRTCDQSNPTKGQPGRSTVDGHEEGEDGESGHGNIKLPGTASCKDERLAICPCLRSDQQRYRHTCVKQLKGISKVKRHIKRDHVERSCDICYRFFGPGQGRIKNHICIPRAIPPVGYISSQRFAEVIKPYAKRGSGLENHLKLLYKQIYPHTPPKLQRVFFNDYMAERLRDLGLYIESQLFRQIVNRFLDEEIDMEAKDRAIITRIASRRVESEAGQLMFSDAMQAPDSENSGRDTYKHQPVYGHAGHNHGSDPATFDPRISMDTDTSNTQAAQGPTSASSNYEGVDCQEIYNVVQSVHNNHQNFRNCYNVVFVPVEGNHGDQSIASSDRMDWEERNAGNRPPKFDSSGNMNTWNQHNEWTNVDEIEEQFRREAAAMSDSSDEPTP